MSTFAALFVIAGIFGTVLAIMTGQSWLDRRRSR